MAAWLVTFVLGGDDVATALPQDEMCAGCAAFGCRADGVPGGIA